MRLLDALRGKSKTPPVAAAKQDRFPTCVNFVLLREGGFVNHPADPGGATNKGITLKVLQEWRGTPCDISDISSITIPEAEAIYRAKYWNPIQGDDLPPGLDLAVFDAAVNSGPVRAAKWLQQALGVIIDGSIGPVTLAAIAQKDPVVVAQKVCALRLEFLKSLRTWPIFGKGWARRVKEVGDAFYG